MPLRLQAAKTKLLTAPPSPIKSKSRSNLNQLSPMQATAQSCPMLTVVLISHPHVFVPPQTPQKVHSTAQQAGAAIAQQAGELVHAVSSDVGTRWLQLLKRCRVLGPPLAALTLCVPHPHLPVLVLPSLAVPASAMPSILASPNHVQAASSSAMVAMATSGALTAGGKMLQDILRVATATKQQRLSQQHQSPSAVEQAQQPAAVQEAGGQQQGSSESESAEEEEEEEVAASSDEDEEVQVGIGAHTTTSCLLCRFSQRLCKEALRVAQQLYLQVCVLSVCVCGCPAGLYTIPSTIAAGTYTIAAGIYTYSVSHLRAC